ncbi:hypothetical protein ONS96_011367 [Cadophora gregata f. sp. sojae]|nr:hypothetical protein ONS96_011367 [Cadophora gregata f. sp. sojae]
MFPKFHRDSDVCSASLEESKPMLDEESVISSRTAPKRLWIYSSIIALVLLSMSLSIIVIFQSRHPLPSWSSAPKIHRSNALSCGETRESALEAGCVFDPLAVSWLHPECINENLSNLTENYRYYETKHLDVLVPTTELIDRPIGSVFWVDEASHQFHCLAAISKWERAVNGGGWVEEDVIAPGHLDHCLKSLIPKEEDRSISIGAMSQVQSCYKIH